MPQHNFGYTAAASINTPAASYAAFYFDANGTPKYKDPAGIHHSMGGLSTWYDVTAYGLVGDDSTANDTTFAALLALAPNGSTIFFPAGTYRFAAEIAVNFDRRLRILGCGRGRSILKTTSATANLFNISVAGFYGSFEELGFASSVTNRTAGSYIIASNNNAYLNVMGCEFQNHFFGVSLTGSGAANLGTIDNCQFTSPSTTAGAQGIVINGSGINMTIQNCTINHGTGGAAIGQGIEIIACGAIQIQNSDIIGGVNALRINTSAIASAIKSSNTFYDQSNGSTVKIQGGGSISRVQFQGGGITSGSASTHAFEVVTTGTGAIGTATAGAAGIDLVGVDLYNTFSSPTNTGVLVTGAQDISVRECRITGFATGVQITSAVSAGYTKFVFADNRIGPNENFTLANGTAIAVNAGSFSYGSYSITNNDLSGNTTPLTDSGAVTTSSQKLISGNFGLAAGIGSVGADQSIAVTTETVVTGLNLFVGANGLRVGTTIAGYVDISSGNVNNITPRIRCGPTGAITDTILVNTAAATVTPVISQVIRINFSLTVKTASSTGTARGQYQTQSLSTVTMTNSAASAATLNTTVSNILIVTLAQVTAGAITVIGGASWVVQQ